MTTPILQAFPLGPRWPTIDPFLFVAHHRDAYPAANDRLGPDASLAGRDLGMDFAGVDGWNMYHGRVVPGFPQHPHRGFETITYVRQGLIDHADSLGASARFGRGDVQWMTAGAGIVHAEMFPLLDPAEPNPVELFQIWLNLPAANKMVEPYFSMLWDREVPRLDVDGGQITVIAGTLDGLTPPAPPPDSWASHADADVALWHVRLDAGASWRLPAAAPGTQRALYLFEGDGAEIGSGHLPASTGGLIDTTTDHLVRAGDTPIEALVMAGRPIAEPVAQYGPFVMNDRAGIETAIRDYQATQFGGWPWPVDDPTHSTDPDRFARHPDGRTERALS